MKKIISCFIITLLVLFLASCTGLNTGGTKTYTVEFYETNGDLIESVTVKEGETAVCSKIPTYDRFLFVGWDKDVTNVTSDIKTKAVIELKSFKVQFLDYDDTVLNEQTVFYGYDAKTPESPTREGYVFLRWDRGFVDVTEDLVIKAVYEPLPTSGSITYYYGKEQLDLYPNEYDFGDEVILPVPEKENAIFLGWYLANRSLTEVDKIESNWSGDMVFYAKFLETTRSLELPEADYHFTSVKKSLHSNGKDYLYQPVFPSGVSTAVTQYTWSTSDSSIAMVSGYSSISIVSSGYCILTARGDGITINCILKVTTDGITVATLDEANTVELCKVTFLGKDGELIKETYCEKNGNVIYPAAPKYEGFKFEGWSELNYNIQEDMTIQAHYSEGTNKYEGKTYAVIGDSISTYSTLIPSGFAYFYPNPVGDVTDYNRTWWMQTINGLGGTLFSNNSYSGSCVASTTGNNSSSVSRLNHTLINGIAPDVILIYMGSNDCASVNVSLSVFKSSYKTMLENLQKMCPDSEIILFTLPNSPTFFQADEWVKYNDVIKKYAEEFELKLVDLSSVNMSGHLVDAAHPRTSGMTLIANKILQTLKEE